ncbi:PDZ domain-containing RING finger protein 4, partial [Varanus komodoensis]
MAINYRPVTNIPFLGKVLERVVAGQLQALLDETDYLDPFQSGFRPGYGTESALVALYDDLCREKDRGSVGWRIGLRRGDKFHSLGVLLDPELSLEAQMTAVARSAFLQLWLIHQLRPYLEYDCLATVTHALVTSRLDFCNALYVGLPLKTVQILQLVQNRAARLLTGTGRYVHMTPVLRQLHWLPIEVRAQFKVLVMTYKALNGLDPGYLKERLHPYTPACPLRSAGEALLREPSVKEIRRGGKPKCLTIMLHRENNTLGFNIVGGQPGQDNHLEPANGIYVSRILKNGPADTSDGMHINDKIIEGKHRQPDLCWEPPEE